MLQLFAGPRLLCLPHAAKLRVKTPHATDEPETDHGDSKDGVFPIVCSAGGGAPRLRGAELQIEKAREDETDQGEAQGSGQSDHLLHVLEGEGEGEGEVEGGSEGKGEGDADESESEGEGKDGWVRVGG